MSLTLLVESLFILFIKTKSLLIFNCYYLLIDLMYEK